MTQSGGHRRATRLIAVVAGVALPAVVASTATAAPPETVSDFFQLSQAVVDVDDGGMIVVDSDIEMTGTIGVPAGKVFTLASDDGAMDKRDSGMLNGGLLRVSGDIVLGDPANQSQDNTVLSPDSPVVVTGALSGHVSVAVGGNPTEGQVIATGNDPAGGVYALTASDADKFSVRDYSTRLDVAQNAVVLTLGSPEVTAVGADPDRLGSEGGGSVITVSGTGLPAALDVAAFVGDRLTSISGQTSTNEVGATVELVFPGNNSAADMVYTVRVSLDGVTWLEQPEAEVTVAAAVQPSMAEPDNNTISAPDQVTAGAAFSFTAHGDRQDATGAAVGDERYVPSRWELNPSGVFVLDGGVYTGTATVAHPGDHTLTVTYVLESFDGTVWTSTGTTDTKTVGVSIITGAETVGGSSTAGPAGWNGRNLPLTGATGVLGWVAAAAAAAVGAGVLLRGVARRVGR